MDRLLEPARSRRAGVDRRKARSVYAANVASIEFVASGTRRIEAADHVHKCRFAAATGTHNRQIFVAKNLQRHTTERVNNFFSHHVVFRDVLDVDDYRLRGSSATRHFATSLSYATFAPSFSFR